MAEVLQDKNSSYLFGELLKRDGQDELARKIVTGEFEQDDIHLLDEYRVKFSEKITHSERIEALLTEENVIEIARNHPNFEKIINLVGPEKAIKAIKSQLKEISITDEYRFDMIAGGIETYDSYKNGEYKTLNDKVEKFCKEKLIKPKEYLDALAIEDPVEKEEALKQLSNRTHGKFKKALNFVNSKWGKNTTLEGLKDIESDLENSVVELDRCQNDIGTTLFLSVGGNDNMRNALSREILSETTPVTESKTGFKDAKKEKEDFDESGFETDWEEYKKQMNYDGSDSSEQDYVKDLFIDKQKEVYRKKSEKVKAKGFWASIFANLFEEKINNKKDTLK